MSGEDELRAALAGARPHPQLAAIPAVLAPWLLPVAWDRSRLWALDRAPSQLPVSALRWLYDLPLWRGPTGAWFDVAPREVLQHPERHPEHRERLEQADLAHPVHALRRHGRWVLLDGVHRLLRADLRGDLAVAAVLVQPEDLRTFVELAP